MKRLFMKNIIQKCSIYIFLFCLSTELKSMEPQPKPSRKKPALTIHIQDSNFKEPKPSIILQAAQAAWKALQKAKSRL